LGILEGVIVKLPLALAVPPAVVTEIPPELAPGITIATILYLSVLTGIAAAPPIEIEIGLRRFEPLMVTKLPMGPELDEKELIDGGSTVKTKPVRAEVP
jgi:hypothetical protein